jgi:hypothetical protein
METPQAFLSSARALTVLRRELDVLASVLRSEIDDRKARYPEKTFDLVLLPNRIIALFAEVGVSFSWVASAATAVAEGELLVIQWNGVAHQARGVAALASARPVREVTYQVECPDPEQWSWRAGPSGSDRFSSTGLVTEWLRVAGQAG